MSNVGNCKWKGTNLLELLSCLKILTLSSCLVIFLTLSSTLAACPAACTCTLTRSGHQTVSCDQSLPGFPQGLSIDTEVLSLDPLPGNTPNNIPELIRTDFTNIRNLTRLTIRRSDVRRIGSGALASLGRLLSLDLRYNKLSRLSRSDLTGLSALVSLDISDNPGCLLDMDVFADLSQLRILRLAKIGLDMVEGILNPITSLRYLDLHGNNLFRLRAASVGMLTNLRHLDISGNDLYGVDESLKPVLASMIVLDVDSNPWRCNCALTWFKSLPRKFVAPSGGGRTPVVCAQPSSLSFLDVWDIPDPRMTCSPAKITSCTGPIIVWEGDFLSITCDVEGDPFPDVTWSRPDGTVVHTDFTFATADTATLVGLKAVYSLHDGSWQVKAISYNTSATHLVKVTVLTLTTHTTDRSSSSSSSSVSQKSANQQNSSIYTSSFSSQAPSAAVFGSFTKRPGGGFTLQGLTPATIQPLPHVSRVSRLNSGYSSTSVPSGGAPHSNTAKPTSSVEAGGFDKNDHRNDGNKSGAGGDSNSTNGGEINHNIIILAAIIAGTVVCVVGMTVFAVTVYKIRKKRQIHARRRRTSAEIYRYNNSANPSNISRTNSDAMYYIRPASVTNGETASVRNVSTIFGPR
ncbi:leucine-rich repeat and fibronectin type-iii domain-containing protein 5 [Plakobranchus ocellatus]|uniref:Leucine-rich repeat and fibronectin type-iii domain-containing protein 5 n=1 Tax=Plakobranchus ocellatus TaxID=259542 RepID=A0AAV3Y688_9GAST|nr:leucine-rich repeat and fibronectin type-iii domain-containing protein 5 [Plakobranchus ocellatus]